MKAARFHFGTLLGLLTLGSLTATGQVFKSDFSNGYQGWTGDFADYPPSDSVFYQLEFTRSPLPAPLPTNQYGLKIRGSNHSDDLFMFIKKRVTGLRPNTTYQVVFQVEFASKAPTNSFGVGGAPGEGVTVKAGVMLPEPKKVFSPDGHYRMNIDKANQNMPGPDMDTIGHVGVADTTTVFALVERNNATHPFTITTDASGGVWICIGTDSGFEALTELYYKEITVTFTGASGVDQPLPASLKIYPNPVQNLLHIETDAFSLPSGYEIRNALGQVVKAGNRVPPALDVYDLPKGVYFLQIETRPGSIPFVKE